ncbi:MAG: MarR family transcriptional regulator [Thermoprotei archaeon]|nr:MarR family transcriptional regulator [Thermoprotei archaeon]
MVKQLANMENDALKLIRDNGGIMLQSDLWKKLKLDSREGSRLVARLVKRGLIKREETLVNGRKTYKLYITESNKKNPPIVISLNSVLNIPCITCIYIDQCSPGNFYEPGTCLWLDNWIKKRTLYPSI